MAAPGVEGSDKSSPGTPNGEVTTSSAERQEYLEVNFKYPFVKIRFILIVSQSGGGSYIHGSNLNSTSQPISRLARPPSLLVFQSFR